MIDLAEVFRYRKAINDGQIPNSHSHSYTTALEIKKELEDMQMYSEAPGMLSFVEPYVCQTLQSVVGRQVAVQTVSGSVRGVLSHVLPDHIVVQVSNTPFFIRTQQIVWVIPSI
jgi:hypothetical protein